MHHLEKGLDKPVEGRRVDAVVEGDAQGAERILTRDPHSPQHMTGIHTPTRAGARCGNGEPKAVELQDELLRVDALDVNAHDAGETIGIGPIPHRGMNLGI